MAKGDITISRDDLMKFGVDCVLDYHKASGQLRKKSKAKPTKHRNPRRRSRRQKRPNTFVKT
jgi:hypothetical protein